MNILLSNDDGVHAVGIRKLHAELAKSHDLVMIAPLEERSTTGHSLTLDKPLRLERLEDGIYGCSGFPGDCVLLGVGHLLKNNRPSLVISGINKGANLGQDLYYSGTIAAAREAAFHRIPSIAVSLAFDSLEVPHHYETAAKIISWLVEEKIHRLCPEYALLNVNVPNVEMDKIRGCKVTKVGFRHYSEEIHARIDARERDYFWIAGRYEGHSGGDLTDCRAVSEGYVSLTPQVLIDGVSFDEPQMHQWVAKFNAKYFT